MEIKRLEGAVEAILFAMGESVELGQIAKAIQQDKPTTEKLLHNLMDKYKDRKVIVSTTVHMERPACMLVEKEDVNQVQRALMHQTGLLWLSDPDCHAA